MQEKGLTINELIIRVQEAMQEGGYSISAVYARYGHWFNVISTYYRKTGRIYYELDVTAEFIALQAERKERSEIDDQQVSFRQLPDFLLVLVIRFGFHRGQGFHKGFAVVVFNRKP